MKYIYLIAIILFMSCKKEVNKKSDVTFFQTKFITYNRLFVDGEMVSLLHRSTVRPECNESIPIKTIVVKLDKDKYYDYWMENDMGKQTKKVRFKVSNDCEVIEVK